MSDLDAVLEAVVASTGVGRYRHLCSDANTLPAPNSAADWRRFIRDLHARDLHARGLDAPRPDVAEAVELTRRMNACPFRSTEGCGCSGARCALRGGAIVSHLDCFACLRRTPE